MIRHTRYDNAAFEEEVSLNQQGGLPMQDLVAEFADKEFRDDDGNHAINSVRSEALEVADERLADVPIG